MCGRYMIDDDPDEDTLRAIIDEANRRAAPVQVRARGEIFPADTVPVLTLQGGMAMQWGFTLPGGSRRIINARREGILERPMFQSPVLQSRCLIPATCYFEWEKVGNQKEKVRIGPRGQRLLFMAGIYRREAQSALPVFSIITRDAAPGLCAIHDRMPLILSPAAQKEWLSKNAAVSDVLRGGVEDMLCTPEGARQLRLF